MWQSSDSFFASKASKLEHLIESWTTWNQLGASHNGWLPFLYWDAKLAFVTPTFCNKTSCFATKCLPFEIRTPIFWNAVLYETDSGKHQNEWISPVFRPFRVELSCNLSFLKVLSLSVVCLLIPVVGWYTAFYVKHGLLSVPIPVIPVCFFEVYFSLFLIHIII